MQMWSDRTDPILHIELRRWADMMVIAPLDANTLAKIANGICDNLLVGTLMTAVELIFTSCYHCIFGNRESLWTVNVVNKYVLSCCTPFTI